MSRTLVLLLPLVIGCGPTYDFAQPSFNENASKVPEPITGARRPQATQRSSFDYASLPLIKPSTIPKAVTMTLSGSTGGAATRASDGYVAMLDVGSQRNFSEGPWGLSAQATGITPFGCAPLEIPAPTPAAPSGALNDIPIANLTKRPGDLAATWVAIHPNHKKPRSFEVLEHTGTLDNARCVTRATEISSVTAVGVVPGILYAYRRCRDASPTTGSCEEELVLIGPPLEWVTSTGETVDKHLRPQLGSFSRIVVPVRPSTAASILVHIRQSELFKWGGANVLDGSFEGATSIQLTCDVVWASSDPAPLASVSVAAVSGPALR